MAALVLGTRYSFLITFWVFSNCGKMLEFIDGIIIIIIIIIYIIIIYYNRLIYIIID